VGAKGFASIEDYLNVPKQIVMGQSIVASSNNNNNNKSVATHELINRRICRE
jgi:hypothetical protein